MKVEYDTPIEVTKEQYNKIMFKLKGIVAGREDAGKYYITLWYPRNQNYFKKLIESLLV